MLDRRSKRLPSSAHSQANSIFVSNFIPIHGVSLEEPATIVPDHQIDPHCRIPFWKVSRVAEMMKRKGAMVNIARMRLHGRVRQDILVGHLTAFDREYPVDIFVE